MIKEGSQNMKIGERNKICFYNIYMREFIQVEKLHENIY